MKPAWRREWGHEPPVFAFTVERPTEVGEVEVELACYLDITGRDTSVGIMRGYASIDGDPWPVEPVPPGVTLPVTLSKEEQARVEDNAWEWLCDREEAAREEAEERRGDERRDRRALP